MGTTTVVKINKPKLCGLCSNEKLEYRSEDYGGIRDTYWFCKYDAWEDSGATFSIKANKTVPVIDVDSYLGIDSNFSKIEVNSKSDIIKLELITREVGERGPDKVARKGRADKGKKRVAYGPNKSSLVSVAAQKSKKVKSK